MVNIRCPDIGGVAADHDHRLLWCTEPQQALHPVTEIAAPLIDQLPITDWQYPAGKAPILLRDQG